MSSNASRNQGIPIIAVFEDRAISVNAPTSMDGASQASRSASDGIRFRAVFADDVQPLNAVRTDTLDALNLLLAQHEQNVQQLVNQLQRTIDELNKQNADLKGILQERDRLIDRYYLNGPNEDDI